MESKNKTILVTASAKRLGKFIAIDLIKKGWKIAIHYNKSKTLAEDTADYLFKIGGNVSIHQADLTSKIDIEKLVKEIESQDSIWVGLINNAAFNPQASKNVKNELENFNLKSNIIKIILRENHF